ncbi:hypothetical protein ACFL0R_02390 [Pseudomonadota bacterium]
MKYLALFLVLFVSIAINLPSGYLSLLGMDPDILLAALFAVLITVLTVHRRLFFVVLVVLVSIVANLPDPSIQRLGVDREILLAGLIALVLIPYVLYMFGYEE